MVIASSEHLSMTRLLSLSPVHNPNAGFLMTRIIHVIIHAVRNLITLRCIETLVPKSVSNVSSEHLAMIRLLSLTCS